MEYNLAVTFGGNVEKLKLLLVLTPKFKWEEWKVEVGDKD